MLIISVSIQFKLDDELDDSNTEVSTTESSLTEDSEINETKKYVHR